MKEIKVLSLLLFIFTSNVFATSTKECEISKRGMDKLIARGGRYSSPFKVYIDCAVANYEYYSSYVRYNMASVNLRLFQLASYYEKNNNVSDNPSQNRRARNMIGNLRADIGIFAAALRATLVRNDQDSQDKVWEELEFDDYQDAKDAHQINCQKVFSNVPRGHGVGCSAVDWGY